MGTKRSVHPGKVSWVNMTQQNVIVTLAWVFCCHQKSLSGMIRVEWVLVLIVLPIRQKTTTTLSTLMLGILTLLVMGKFVLHETWTLNYFVGDSYSILTYFTNNRRLFGQLGINEPISYGCEYNDAKSCYCMLLLL